MEKMKLETGLSMEPDSFCSSLIGCPVLTHLLQQRLDTMEGILDVLIQLWVARHLLKQRGESPVAGTSLPFS